MGGLTFPPILTPSLEAVRGLVVQIGKGLQALHRLEMLHQDLRPDNIIDFGFTRVAGLADFLYDLRQPNQAFLQRTRVPLIERNPLVFWKSVSTLLAGGHPGGI